MRSAVVLAALPTRRRRRIAGQSPRPASCPYQAQVIVYGQNGWETLTSALAANQTPCANYYVVVTAIGDKTKPRAAGSRDRDPREGAELPRTRRVQHGRLGEGETGELVGEGPALPTAHGDSRLRPGARHVGGQRALERGPHEAGLAGESPRCDAGGLYTGPRGAPPQQGAVFVVGLGQQLANFGPTRASSKAGSATRPGGPPCRRTWPGGRRRRTRAARASASPAAKVGARSTRLNEFTEHPARLAFAGPPQAAPARALFDRAYVPLMTAYWRDAKGYGNNRDLARPDADAREPRGLRGARAGRSATPYPDGRIGFAWNEHPPGATPAQVQALATRVAQSIQAAYGDGGTATRRAARPVRTRGARPSSAAPRFNPGWASCPRSRFPEIAAATLARSVQSAREIERLELASPCFAPHIYECDACPIV